MLRNPLLSGRAPLQAASALEGCGAVHMTQGMTADPRLLPSFLVPAPHCVSLLLPLGRLAASEYLFSLFLSVSPSPLPGFCFNPSVAEMQRTQRAYFYQRFPILHLESGDWLLGVVSCVWRVPKPCENAVAEFSTPHPRPVLPAWLFPCTCADLGASGSWARSRPPAEPASLGQVWLLWNFMLYILKGQFQSRCPLSCTPGCGVAHCSDGRGVLA